MDSLVYNQYLLLFCQQYRYSALSTIYEILYVHIYIYKYIYAEKK